jgi:DNA-binding transcriptional regulator of glucitol operon
MRPMSLFFLAFAFVWMLQLILSLLQTKRFHQQVANLRKLGPATAVGQSGRNWTLKKYGVMVCDEERNVVKAQSLTGITVFSNLKDVPELTGLPLERFNDENPVEGVSKKLWSAFMNAADFIARHDRKLAEEESDDGDSADYEIVDENASDEDAPIAAEQTSIG